MLGVEAGPPRFGLTVAEEARAGADRLLREGGWRVGPAMLVVAPGARWETKIWPKERFVETIDRLCEDGSNRAVLVGSPEDAGCCDWIRDRSRTAPVSLAGRTSVPELVAVIERADLVICQDSAPMHIAAALDRPLVCLIGPTNPHRTGPYSREGDVVRLALDCSPCYFRRLSQCPHDHRCMAELDVGRVVEAAHKTTIPAV
jgi:lipopolysaccharide heptosyltransferase II